MNRRRIGTVSSILFCLGLIVLSSMDNPEASFAQSARGSSIVTGGLERTYRIYISALYSPAKLMPLVILLHGGGGMGQGMEKLTLGGFNHLADREEGFVVVYLDGIEKHWNDGRGLQNYRPIEKISMMSALSLP